MAADTHISQIPSQKAVRLHFIFGSDHPSHQMVILSLSLPRAVVDFLPDKGTISVRLTLPAYQQFLHQRPYQKSNCQFPHIYRGKQRVTFQRLPTQGKSQLEHLQHNQLYNKARGDVVSPTDKDSSPGPSTFTKIHSRFYCRTHRLLSLWQQNPRGLPK